MSLHVFQSALARLIIDPAFRDRVAAGAGLPAEGLDARETRRLHRIALDRGLDINRTLHKGFRLGKLRALLPLTCQALGPKRLAREVDRFWRRRPPSSFHFLPEALDFCDFLAAGKPRGKYLAEVVAYERAALELERARIGEAPAQVVHFRHDPRALLACLAAGRRPRGIAELRCRATGSRTREGRVEWRLSGEPAPPGVMNDACAPSPRVPARAPRRASSRAAGSAPDRAVPDPCPVR